MISYYSRLIRYLALSGDATNGQRATDRIFAAASELRRGSILHSGHVGSTAHVHSQTEASPALALQGPHSRLPGEDC